MVTSENCCIFIVLNYKVLQTIIAMLTEDKVTELFFMAEKLLGFTSNGNTLLIYLNTGKNENLHFFSFRCAVLKGKSSIFNLLTIDKRM